MTGWNQKNACFKSFSEVKYNQMMQIFLFGDWILGSSFKVSYILNLGLCVLIYSSNKDFILNWRGGEAWTSQVGKEVKNAYCIQIYQDGKSLKNLYLYKNLKFGRVYDAGQMRWLPLIIILISINFLLNCMTSLMFLSESHNLYY